MPASPDDLFHFLDGHEIAYATSWHEATFTVEEGRALKADMPGAPTKNLFMKDKDGALVLISADADSELKLNRLHREIGTKRLSFASAELLYQHLGVRPGSVTAFSLINDVEAQAVRFVIDAALMSADEVNFHPLTNTGTTRISRADLERFVAATGHEMTVVDFVALAAD